MGNLISSMWLTCMFLDFGTKPGYTSKPTRTTENMQTSHRKATGCFEATMLTIKSLCRPCMWLGQYYTNMKHKCSVPYICSDFFDGRLCCHKIFVWLWITVPSISALWGISCQPLLNTLFACTNTTYNFTLQKFKLVLTRFISGIGFFDLIDIWNGPSPSWNAYYGQMADYRHSSSISIPSVFLFWSCILLFHFSTSLFFSNILCWYIGFSFSLW